MRNNFAPAANGWGFSLGWRLSYHSRIALWEGCMFRDALDRACKFTFPVVQCSLTVEGRCAAGAAAFIGINSDGWIVTAAHVMKASIALAHADTTARQWEAARDAINGDSSLNAKARIKKLEALGRLNKKVTRRGTSSWGFNGVRVVDVSMLEEADLAVAKLENLDQTWISEYPKLKDPNKGIQPGASLCKLGYPFAEMTRTYDEATNSFDLPPDKTQLAFFPIEGIFTRTLVVSPAGATAPFPIMFIETSSPGLRGQSGGPTFDTDGVVWAIQSQTGHLPLGFSPEDD